MSLTTLNTLTVGSGYALQVNASDNYPLNLYVKDGGTLYYKSEPSVTSSSSSVAKEASVVVNTTTWIISASQSTVEVRQQSPVYSIEPPVQPPAFYAGFFAPQTATSGTDATPAEKKLYVTQLFVPCNKRVKGIGYLVGSVGGTNKAIAALFDYEGNKLANSTETTEGTTVGTAAEVQSLALAAPYNLIGPGTYYIGITMNGNTARYRSLVANTASPLGTVTGEISLTTKNVLPASVTLPTEFAAGKGPVAWVY